MSFLKKLFGGGGNESASAKAASEEYNEYRITPTPVREASGYRVSALIEKDVAGETRQHQLVRADTLQGLEDAEAASIRKAKQVIDEQGDRIFD